MRFPGPDASGWWRRAGERSRDSRDRARRSPLPAGLLRGVLATSETRRAESRGAGRAPGRAAAAEHIQRLAGASSALPGRSAHCAAGLVGGFFLSLGMRWGQKSVLDKSLVGGGDSLQSFQSNFSSFVDFPY